VRPTSTTLRNLLTLVSDLIISNETVLLYIYYCMYGHTAPTREETKIGTSLGRNTILKHDKLLEALKAIKRYPAPGRSRRTQVDVFPVIKPTQPSATHLINILNIPSQKDNAARTLSGVYDRNSVKKGGRGVGRFSIHDITDDEDWKKAKASLEKYFKPFEIDPSVLTKKDRFSKLVELVEDKTFDFDRYCKWYREEKYSSGKGFSYGLFLYPGMLSEYLSIVEATEAGGPQWESEENKRRIQETKDFIDTLQD